MLELPPRVRASTAMRRFPPSVKALMDAKGARKALQEEASALISKSVAAAEAFSLNSLKNSGIFVYLAMVVP